MSDPTEESPGTLPAFPLGGQGRLIASELNGLTRREYYAIQLFNGLIVGRRMTAAAAHKKLVADAIRYADELINQLEKMT